MKRPVANLGSPIQDSTCTGLFQAQEIVQSRREVSERSLSCHDRASQRRYRSSQRPGARHDNLLDPGARLRFAAEPRSALTSLPPVAWLSPPDLREPGVSPLDVIAVLTPSSRSSFESRIATICPRSSTGATNAIRGRHKRISFPIGGHCGAGAEVFRGRFLGMESQRSPGQTRLRHETTPAVAAISHALRLRRRCPGLDQGSRWPLLLGQSGISDQYAMDRLRSETPADTEGVLGKTDYDLSPTFLADQFRLDDEQVLSGKRIVNRIELVGQPEGLTVWSVTNKIPILTFEPTGGTSW